MWCKLYLMYPELEAVITDEISMVSNIKLYQNHCRLCEIFIISLDILFAGLAVIFFRRLLSIARCSGKEGFVSFDNGLMTLRNFSYFELTEVMRQQGDSIFIDLLNNVRVGAVLVIDIALKSPSSCAINNLSPPVEDINLITEKIMTDNSNDERMMKLSYLLIGVPSTKVQKYNWSTESRRCFLVKVC